MDELPQTEDQARHGRRRTWVERRDGPELDWVAVEAPLEIRVQGEPLAVTLRTPGHDRELVAGFLFSEGVIDHRDELAALEAVHHPADPGDDSVIGALLRSADEERLRRARRQLPAVAACGLCGKERLADLFQRLPRLRPLTPPCERELIEALPALMRARQTLFATTGGLHAAALFDCEGHLLSLYEDVGRHNAVDKVIGHAVLAGEMPLEQRILVVSARAGFEIVQKAMRAGVPVLAAVGAASSLAVELAQAGGLELYSFVRPGRSNRHLGAAAGDDG